MIKINLLGQVRPQTKNIWNPFSRKRNPENRSTTTLRPVPASATLTFVTPPPDRRPSLRMLADQALSSDYGDKLGFKPFADAIAGIIDSPNTSTPLVMAINARWGAGKTTLGQMVKRRLETKPAADGVAPHLTCWFPAWMHDEAPVLSTSLASEIAQVASASRSFWRKIVSPLPPALSSARQRGVRRGSKYLGCLILLVFLLTVVSLRNGYGLGFAARFVPEAFKTVASLKGGTYLAGLIVLALLILFKGFASALPIAKSVGEFVRSPRSSAKTASMEEVRRELGSLIKHATPKGSKFIVFIDDLDRCRPPKSVEVLEAVNQLLDHDGVVIVLMSDMQVVAESVEVKYKELAKLKSLRGNKRSLSGSSTYGWNFLQKIVQLQLDLPMYSEGSIRRMLEDLAREVPEQRPSGWVAGTGQKIAILAQRAVALATSARFWFQVLHALIYVVTLGLMLLFAKVLAPHLRTPLKLPAFVAGGALGLVFGELSLRLFMWRRQSSRRDRIDNQIRSTIAAGERDFTKVAQIVRSQNADGREDGATEGLVRERLQRYLEDESEIQREAEDEVMQYLEPVPRHAKRVLNRLRLLLFIAHERKMFGGSPQLSARHIGKWAVLGERWPELSQAVCSNPSAMAELEKEATHDSWVNRLAPMYENDEALRRFCLSVAAIRLAPVIRRIVEFSPSSNLV